MNNTLTQSPSAKPSSLVLDLKNSIKNNISKFLGKNETATTSKSTQQAEIGRTKAFSNRTAPEFNNKTAKAQSKEVNQAPINNDIKESSNNKAESSTHGKEIGADLKVPGCSGGCGCDCGK